MENTQAFLLTEEEAATLEVACRNQAVETAKYGQEAIEAGMSFGWKMIDLSKQMKALGDRLVDEFDMEEL